MITVKTPELAESVAEATLLDWQKQPGDAVAEGEILVSVETDKIVLEVYAPQGGVLQEILKKEGDSVVSDEPLARIDETAQAASAPAPAPKAAEKPQPAPATACCNRRARDERSGGDAFGAQNRGRARHRIVGDRRQRARRQNHKIRRARGGDSIFSFRSRRRTRDATRADEPLARAGGGADVVVATPKRVVDDF